MPRPPRGGARADAPVAPRGDEKYKALAKHFVDVRGEAPELLHGGRKRAAAGTSGPARSSSTPITRRARCRCASRRTPSATPSAPCTSTPAWRTSRKRREMRALLAACRRLWDSITQRRMYVTGGIGSTFMGEAFTVDYDLPNDTVYAETCASIGLMFFAKQMLENEHRGVYGDVMERAFHNTVLAGMQLDGKRFFYVNPLESVPGVSGAVVTHRSGPARAPAVVRLCLLPAECRASRLLTRRIRLQRERRSVLYRSVRRRYGRDAEGHRPHLQDRFPAWRHGGVHGFRRGGDDASRSASRRGASTQRSASTGGGWTSPP